MRYIIILSIFCLNAVHAQEPYTLEKYVSEMLEQDFGIQLLKNNIQIAKNNNNPGNAGYLPTIDIVANQNFSSTNTRQEYFSGDIKQANGAKNSSTNAGIVLNWTFFDGFKMFATDKKLDILEEISTLNLTAEMEMKIYQASVLFYTLSQQEKLNDVYEKGLELSKARYDLMLLKKNNGAASEIQLIQSRLDLSADSSVYLTSLKTLENLKADLNMFLAKDPTSPISIEGEIETNDVLSWESIYESAKAQNTSLLVSKSTIALREKERKEAQSYFYPQLSLFGQYNFAHSKSQIGFLLSNSSVGPGVGIGLKWNILDRLTKYTNLKNNKIQLENAEIAQEQQELTIQTELRKSFNEYEWSKRNLQMEQRNMNETSLNFQIAENAFKAGSITNLELREIQFSIIEANSRFIIAQLMCKTAELNLSLITGDFKSLFK